MCGVIATLALGTLDKKDEQIRQDAMRFLSTELLQVTVDRGKEATGIATLFNNGDYMMLKMGISAPEFIARFGGTETDYDGFMKVWRKNIKPAKVAIGHCRKPSTGGNAGAWDNCNNHPIRSGEIVGVHNGTIKNHLKIQRLLDVKADGKVDSEAIMQLLNHFSEDGTRPWTCDMIKEVAKRIEGQYCVLAFSGNNPHQLAVFRDGRPLEMVLIKPLNLIALASERKFLNSALFRWNKMAKLYGHDEYPYLNKDNLDFLMLPDDTAAVFDLRYRYDEVEEAKKKDLPAAVCRIEDFYDSEKIPRTEKIWNNGTTTTTTHTPKTTGNTTTPNTSAPAGKTTGGAATGAAADNKSGKTEVNALPAKKGAGKKDEGKDKPAGRIFCRTLKEFKDAPVIEDTKNVSNVVADPEDGSVKSAETDEVVVEGKKEDAVSDMTLDDTDKPTSLIDDPAKVNEIAVEEIEKEKGKDAEDSEEASVEVDMTVDPEAVEAAEAASEQIQKYENAEEVADALDTTGKSLQALPIHSLANRMKKTFFKMGYTLGFTDGKKSRGSGEVAQGNPKALKQRKNIRVLKNLLKTVSQLFVTAPIESRITEGVTKAFQHGMVMDSETLDRLLSEGDFRQNEVLGKVVEEVKKREQRG